MPLLWRLLKSNSLAPALYINNLAAVPSSLQLDCPPLRTVSTVFTSTWGQSSHHAVPQTVKSVFDSSLTRYPLDQDSPLWKSIISGSYTPYHPLKGSVQVYVRLPSQNLVHSLPSLSAELSLS